jgi:SAM-dependent methyltransferase
VSNKQIYPIDLSRLRDLYEEEGVAARNSGNGINCSEQSIRDVVLRMATEYLSDYETIADVGCGANLLYDCAIADLGKKVVGVDFTKSFLDLAPADPRIALVQGDATLLPFPDAAFDAVICSETLEHIPDDGRAARELARVIRPGGWLFLTVPNLWNASRIIEMIRRFDYRVRLMPSHLREYSPREVRSLLAGRFEIKKFYPVGFGWEGSPIGGRIERLIEGGPLSRFSKSIAVAARKL